MILRPQPGAAATARRAAALGLEPIVAPLFEIRPIAWEPPSPGRFDAVLLTSANGARCAGADLARFASLPCYAVGAATGAAARAAGFGDVRASSGDGAAAVAAMAADGVGAALHLCGRDHKALRHDRIAIARRIVYASETAAHLTEESEAAIAARAVVLVHSPRAGALLADLVSERDTISLAAISAAAASAAGDGWRSVSVAAAPSDAALLELAVKLCHEHGDAR